MARNVEEHIIRLKDEMSSKLNTIQKSVDGMRGSMNKTNKSISQVQSNLSRFKGVGKGVTRVLGGIGLAFGGIQLGRFAQQSVDTAIELQNMRNKMNFATRSVHLGGVAFKFASDLAMRLGTDLRATISGYTDLQAASIGTALSFKDVQNVFRSTSEAAAVLHLSADTTKSVFLALEQMMSKGKVSMEELRRQFGNAMPGAMSLFARAMGVSVQKLDEMVSNGELLAVDVFPKLSKEMDKTFSPGLQAAIESANNKTQRFKNELDLLRKDVGEKLIPVWLKFFKIVGEGMDKYFSGMGMRNVASNLAGLGLSGLSKEAQDSSVSTAQEFSKENARLDLQSKVAEKTNDLLEKLTKSSDFTPENIKKLEKQVLDPFLNQAGDIRDQKKFFDNTLRDYLKEQSDLGMAAGVPFTDAAARNAELAAVIPEVASDLGEQIGKLEAIDVLPEMVKELIKLRKEAIVSGELFGSEGGKDTKKGLKSGISTIRSQTPKNITINIGSLIGNSNVGVIKEMDDKKLAKKIEKVTGEALLRVVNDATTINEK